MNITKISIEKPKLVVVLFSLVIFLGIFSYFFLSYELVPKFTPPVFTVVTTYPGATPREVEEDVSIIIEDALSSIEKVDQITSFSQENFSVIKLELLSSADVDKSLQEASRKLQTIADKLPDGAGKPVLRRFDFDDLPVLRMGAFSDLPPSDFTTFVKDQIQPKLTAIEGVAQVALLGGREREILVSVDPAKLDIYGVSIMQVVQAVGLANLNVPAAKLKSGDTQKLIRLSGKFTSIDDLRQLVVADKVRMGAKIRLEDVASVYDTYTKPEVITRINGRNSLGIEIRKQADANAVEMSRLVKASLEDLKKQHADINLNFEVAQDSSLFTIEAADAVMTDLAYAVLLVSLIMLLFLHSLRNSLFVLISIPLSIISTFIVMYVLGYTLNLLSLLGLSLAIGILVDDSIVVIENIYRHMEMGKNRVRAAYEGRVEIGFTAISITLIDVVVFLPIVFASGLVADLLRQFSVVIIASTLMSLFVSFTIAPLLASRFAKLESLNTSGWVGRLIISFEEGLNFLIDRLLTALTWAFRHKITTLIIALTMFLGSLSLIYFGFIGLEFTKAGDRAEFIIELELPKNVTLEETNRVALEVEAYLRKAPEILSVFTTVGVTSSANLQSYNSNLAEMSIVLVDKNLRDFPSYHIARNIKYELEGTIPGLIVHPMEINLIGIRDDDAVQITITGNDNESISEYAGQVVEVMEQVPGVVEINTSAGKEYDEISVEIDRDKLSGLGVTIGHAGMALRTAFYGNRDAGYHESGKKHNINIIMDEFNRREPADIENLTVLNNVGQPVKFSQFAYLIDRRSPSGLERTGRSSSITIKSQVIGRPAGTVGLEIKEKMEAIDVPEGISYFFGGQTKRTMDGVSTMLFALVISIVLVYLILVAVYDSYYYPFVVLFSIPLAVIGALLVLALTQQALNIFSILGMVILVGLVGKNAILVVDFTNNLKKQGMELKEALFQATRLRFRPILMTNITMIIGLMPIALAHGAGSEWKNGLAWALIGGLSSSMFLTLIIVPVIYYVFDRGLEKSGIVWGKKVKVPEK